MLVAPPLPSAPLSVPSARSRVWPPTVTCHGAADAPRTADARTARTASSACSAALSMSTSVRGSTSPVSFHERAAVTRTSARTPRLASSAASTSASACVCHFACANLRKAAGGSLRVSCALNAHERSLAVAMSLAAASDGTWCSPAAGCASVRLASARQAAKPAAAAHDGAARRRSICARTLGLGERESRYMYTFRVHAPRKTERAAESRRHCRPR